MRKILNSFLLVFLLFAFAMPIYAAEVTLEWDSNPETNIAGYEIYYGPSSGDYSDMVDVGNVTTCILSTLEPGVTYYFAAKAYNTEGYYSDYSDEVSFTPAIADIQLAVDSYTGDSVTLSWNATVFTLVSAYRIKFGSEPEVYSELIEVGPDTLTVTINGLTEDRYYFVAYVVGEYQYAGLESNEVVWIQPTPSKPVIRIRPCFVDSTE